MKLSVSVLEHSKGNHSTVCLNHLRMIIGLKI
nr:MAG TPA: hypothetical protein [Caudoviricetes sp.]DAR83629.1 MAG TPA: hypothetical protein [Caudoviricetes sp.]